MEISPALLALCDGVSPEIPLKKRPVMQSFDSFFHLRLNKRLSKNRDAGDLSRYCAHYDVIMMLM